MLLLSAAVWFAQPYPANGVEQKREIQCSNGNDKLTEYVGSDQKLAAVWGQKGPSGYFYCGFHDGYKIRLKDLTGFVGNQERDLQNVSVYRGLSDSCSQGKLLIFNERVKSVAILNIQDFSTEKYQCSNP